MFWSLNCCLHYPTVCGLRTVPIELGSTYLDNDSSQVMITINEFIDTFIVGSRDSNSSGIRGRDDDTCCTQSIGYLAQHQLFRQIPALRRDIDIPGMRDYTETYPIYL